MRYFLPFDQLFFTHSHRGTTNALGLRLIDCHNCSTLTAKSVSNCSSGSAGTLSPPTTNNAQNFRYRYACSHMPEFDFWWYLVNIIEGHNRWVLSAGDPDAITAASPCVAAHEHQPDDVWLWVVTWPSQTPVTQLGRFLQSLPPFLAKQMSATGAPPQSNVFQVVLFVSNVPHVVSDRSVLWTPRHLNGSEKREIRRVGQSHVAYSRPTLDL